MIKAAAEEMGYCLRHSNHMFWPDSDDHGPVMYTGSPPLYMATEGVWWLWMPLWGSPPPTGRRFDSIVPPP